MKLRKVVEGILDLCIEIKYTTYYSNKIKQQFLLYRKRTHNWTPKIPTRLKPCLSRRSLSGAAQILEFAILYHSVWKEPGMSTLS
jgi:hypothetical protein